MHVATGHSGRCAAHYKFYAETALAPSRFRDSFDSTTLPPAVLRLAMCDRGGFVQEANTCFLGSALHVLLQHNQFEGRRPSCGRFLERPDLKLESIVGVGF